jgi:hypothetical protein
MAAVGVPTAVLGRNGIDRRTRLFVGQRVDVPVLGRAVVRHPFKLLKGHRGIKLKVLAGYISLFPIPLPLYGSKGLRQIYTF